MNWKNYGRAVCTATPVGRGATGIIYHRVKTPPSQTPAPTIAVSLIQNPASNLVD